MISLVKLNKIFLDSLVDILSRLGLLKDNLSFK